MTAGCEGVARRRAGEDVDHLGFLLPLGGRELIGRERRAARRRLKAARLPTVEALAAFDSAAAPSPNKPRVLERARREFVEGREDLLPVGGPGPGKAHRATALGVEACGRGQRARSYRVTELATRLMESREERQPGPMRARPGEPDLLILDELGYVPASKAGAELLFDVIGAA